jgi:hypothetical protein
MIKPNKLSIEEKISLAKDSNTSLETLSLIANNTNLELCYWLIRNSNITPEIISPFSEIDKISLSVDVNTPTHILDIFANDEYLTVRCAVADNPNISDETLERLVKDNSAGVRFSANMALKKN